MTPILTFETLQMRLYIWINTDLQAWDHFSHVEIMQSPKL